MNDEPLNLMPSNAEQARQWIADLNTQLVQHDVLFRDPPEEPSTCCGRGCNGCVWEGYLSAVAYWCEQAREVLLKKRHDHHDSPSVTVP
jgi:hypothetical protein